MSELNTLFEKQTESFCSQMLTIVEPADLVSFAHGFMGMNVAVMAKGVIYSSPDDWGFNPKSCIVLSKDSVEFAPLDDEAASKMTNVKIDESSKYAGTICSKVRSFKTEKLYGRTEKSENRKSGDLSEKKGDRKPDKYKGKPKPQDAFSAGYNVAPKQVQEKQKQFLKQNQPMFARDRFGKPKPSATTAIVNEPSSSSSSSSTLSSPPETTAGGAPPTASVTTAASSEPKKEKSSPSRAPPPPSKGVKKPVSTEGNWDDLDV